VQTGLMRRWPQNLSVRRLIVIGALSVQDIEYLGSIDCEFELHLDSVAAENMYQLLERIGHCVKTLVIKDWCQFRIDNVYIPSDIILERVLAACPNLEQFEFNTSRSVVQDSRHDMPPSAFKNYRK